MAKEWLDSKAAKGEELKVVLQQLDQLNTLFGTKRKLWNGVKKTLITSTKPHSLVLLDLGCGSGQNLAYVANKVARLGITPILIGIDQNPESLELAAKHCKPFEFRPILGKVSIDTKFPQHDILISSQFLYHFQRNQCQQLVKAISKSNRMGVVFSEWTPSKITVFLFEIYCRGLGYNKHILQDGVLALKTTHPTIFWRKLLNGHKQIKIKTSFMQRVLIYGKLEF